MHADPRERRRTARRVLDEREPLSRVRLRAGRELTVVNLSASGALVEGTARLLPGTHVDVHVVTRHGRVLVRSRIVRAYVWNVQADMVCYRGALAFDRLVDTAAAGYALPHVLLDPVATPGPAYPPSSAADNRPIETTVSA